MRTDNWLVVVAAALLLVACGQKGPLRLPAAPDAEPVDASTPAQTPDTADPTAVDARRENPHE
jgi:predicted small lipoprotein YifL